jgi:hypothetical protein
MTEQGLDPSEDRPVEGRDWSKSKVPSAGLIWTRPSFRVNGWVAKRGPTGWSSARRSSSSGTPGNLGASAESSTSEYRSLWKAAIVPSTSLSLYEIALRGPRLVACTVSRSPKFVQGSRPSPEAETSLSALASRRANQTGRADASSDSRRGSRSQRASVSSGSHLVHCPPT